VFFARWKDNGVVTIGSTVHGVTPQSKTKRYSKTQKKIVQVDMPNCVFMYNKYMGGTDQMLAIELEFEVKNGGGLYLHG